MAIHVTWHDEVKRILVYRIEGQWQMSDLYDAIQQGTAISGHITDDLYIIYDVSGSVGIPASFMSALQYMNEHYQENVRLRVVVGATKILEKMYEVVSRVAPRLGDGFRFVQTFDDALEKIERLRQENQSD